MDINIVFRYVHSFTTLIDPYSILKLLTGFIRAARIDWKLTVPKVIIKAPAAATTKNHKLTSIRYSYLSNHDNVP